MNPDLRKLVKGIMIESYLEDGSQSIEEGVYGKSITDPCLGWERRKPSSRNWPAASKAERGAYIHAETNLYFAANAKGALGRMTDELAKVGSISIPCWQQTVRNLALFASS